MENPQPEISSATPAAPAGSAAPAASPPPASSKAAAPPPIHVEGVPQPLLDRLHQANLRFHQSKKELEESMNSMEYRHQQRINVSGDQLRAAEGELEAVQQEIRDFLARMMRDAG